MERDANAIISKFIRYQQSLKFPFKLNHINQRVDLLSLGSFSFLL